MKHKILLSLTIFTVMFLSAADISADQRWYVWTYEYKTVKAGTGELESYYTLSTDDIESLEGNMDTEFKIEMEFGMTDRFDFSIYQVFTQKAEKEFKYKGFQLRARYKIGEKDRYILDPLIYLEYKGKPDFSEHGIEFKLILAKDIGRFNLALNPILEFEYEDEWEFEPEYTVGISYEFIESLRLGLEAKGSEYANYIGPVIAHGKGNLWITLGSAFSIGEVKEGKPEFQLRMLLGIGL